jgi:hypothetical protein
LEEIRTFALTSFAPLTAKPSLGVTGFQCKSRHGFRRNYLRRFVEAVLNDVKFLPIIAVYRSRAVGTLKLARDQEDSARANLTPPADVQRLMPSKARHLSMSFAFGIEDAMRNGSAQRAK